MEDRDTELPVGIDVGVEDGPQKTELGWRVGVVVGEDHLGLGQVSMGSKPRQGHFLGLLRRGPTNLEITTVEGTVWIDHHQGKLPAENVGLVGLYSLVSFVPW